MDSSKIIEQALQEIAVAESMIDNARIKYSSAKKKLESICYPVKRKSVLSAEQIAKLLYKRPKKVNN